MNPGDLKETLRSFKAGVITEEEVIRRLRHLPFQDLQFARVDHHRTLRQGFPEVIFGQGKSDPQILQIARALLEKNSHLLITRTSRDVFQALAADYSDCRFHEACGAVTVGNPPPDQGRGVIGVFSAGTSDIGIAEEAAVAARSLGNRVTTCYDVGVAGLHRLLGQMPLLDSCTVAVVVAGMEGALPSVVGGLVGVPVIAVPTSIGYGASFGGLAALLGMLNSCSPNVSVVNIDNGFGAGFVAGLINRRSTPAEAKEENESSGES